MRITRTEMDVHYDTTCRLLDRMNSDFALWYLLGNYTEELEKEVKSIKDCETREEVAFLYCMVERLRVLREMRDDLATSLF